jgi:D-ribose pyranase
MKKNLLIHIALSRLIASLGHGDAVVVCDAGLPVPPGVEVIDLALSRGVPGFAETLKAILSEMQVERHLIAEEFLLKPSPPWAAVEALTQAQQLGARQMVDHEAFKRQSRAARAFVRTGEYTPYANIILYAGVVF